MSLSPSRRARSVGIALLLAAACPALVAVDTPDSASASADVPAAVPGLEIARPGGGFLGVTVQGASLRVTFYDAERKKTAADAARVVARWHDGRPRRAVLNTESPESFVSPPVLSPPFKFMAYIVLVRENEKEAETHAVNFNPLFGRPEQVTVPTGGPS